MKVCLLIPIYNHGGTIRSVVDRLEPLDLPCFIVDDGSAASTRIVLDGLARDIPWVHVERLPVNQGRGAALRHGYRVARARGYTHAVQLDADGQHDPADVPALLSAARGTPDALVLGAPQFDETAPASRRYGRLISTACVWLETLSFEVADPLCGLRCIPLESACALLAETSSGDRMEFDLELVVRLVWARVPIRNVRTRTRYDARGISHFRMVQDNARISWSHARLISGMLARVPTLLRHRRRRTPSRRSWAALGERGSISGMRLTVWFYQLFGERLAELFILPIVTYFFLTDRRSRRFSRSYLQRLYTHPAGKARLGSPPRAWHSFWHFRAFGLALLDRVGFWSGYAHRFKLSFHGGEHFTSLLAERRGAILIGAHIGSFDALRALAARWEVVVNVLMSTRHAPRINRVLRDLSPGSTVRVIEIEPNSSRSVFEIRACVERGEFVAILGDRVSPGARARIVEAEFLGARVPFPSGPFQLANRLGCPAIMVVGLRQAPGRYEIMAEPLGKPLAADTSSSVSRVADQVQTYAHLLESYCLRAPYQWFNFYDFWDDEAKA